jgi:outer membrane receptor protein involved in Fe transport
VKSTDLYVGDTILLGNLTLQAGLRWDNQKAFIEAGRVPVNNLLPDVLPAIDYSKSGDLEWTTVSPRIGLTYALGAEKTALRRRREPLRRPDGRLHDLRRFARGVRIRRRTSAT